MKATLVALVTTAALATLVATVTNTGCANQGVSLRVVPRVTMADDSNENKRRPGWHLRPFSETLKRKCGGRAKEEGKPEYQWVTEVLCKELGITADSLVVLDSKLKEANENGQGTVRHNSPPDARKGSAKNRRNTQT
jgi:hypothetical protein